MSQLYIHTSDPQSLRYLPAHLPNCENWAANATTEQILAAGYRPYTPATAPDGDRITESHIEHDAWRAWQVIDATANIADEAAAAQAAFEAAEVERKNTPLVFDQPIELPAAVLLSHASGIGVGVIASDAGELVTFTYHASPIPSPAEIAARKDAAIAARAAARAAAAEVVTESRAAGSAAAAAGNSLPALRAAVEKLAAAVEKLAGVSQ
jgi:hypothetical protein